MNFNYWDEECECGHERRIHRIYRHSDETLISSCKGDSKIKRPPQRGISAAVVRGQYLPCDCKSFDESFASAVKFEREMEKEKNGK